MRGTRPMTLAFLLVFAAHAGAFPLSGHPDPGIAQRIELARSFLRFEETYRAHPPGPARQAEINRAFDRATFALLRGALSNVARELDEISEGLRPDALNTRAHLVAHALRVRIEPPILVVGDETVPVARVSLSREVWPDDTFFVLRIETAGHVQDFALEKRTIREPIGIRLKLEHREPGTRTVSVVLADGTVLETGSWFVCAKDPQVQQRANSRRLASVSTDVRVLADAVCIARDRNALLGSRPPFGRSIGFFLNPPDLAADLDVEIAAILAGKDPYQHRPGHLWRELPVGKLRIPLRIYAPAAVTKGRPLPVVVALHGAGADENIFPEGYGAGEIVRQADEHGFILASPATGPFMLSPRSLGVLLDTLELHLAIDRRRVYVIGHSMGAMATIALARRHHDLVEAACAIAGGDVVSSRGKMAPTLFVTGDLDRIVPTVWVKGAYERARKAGQPVEFRQATGYGHTLLVGDLLPECIAWLMKHAPETTEEKIEPGRGD